MARLKAVKHKDHRLVISTDRNEGQVYLVRGGPRRAYLWAGRNFPNSGCVTVSGYKVLRRLAYEILHELGGR